VADAAGRFWITWYDTRYLDARLRFARVEVIGGRAEVTQRGWVTDAAPPFTTSRIFGFLGDYMGLAESRGVLYAAWGDLRELAVGGRPRIYISRAVVP
jgi:hypothetical protein